jgi:hypothetical protein
MLQLVGLICGYWEAGTTQATDSENASLSLYYDNFLLCCVLNVFCSGSEDTEMYSPVKQWLLSVFATSRMGFRGCHWTHNCEINNWR